MIAWDMNLIRINEELEVYYILESTAKSTDFERIQIIQESEEGASILYY